MVAPPLSFLVLCGVHGALQPIDYALLEYSSNTAAFAGVVCLGFRQYGQEADRFAGISDQTLGGDRSLESID